MAAMRTLVHGVTGRMGQEVIKALCAAPDMAPVGGVCRNPAHPTLALPDGSGSVPLASDIAGLLSSAHPGAVVDFSNAEACVKAGLQTLKASIPFVTGTSGLSEKGLELLDSAALEGGVGVVVAPNFALGAVILMSLAKKAAPFFDYVDIIEAHHEQKIDAPSGTALALARAVSDGKSFTHRDPERETLAGTAGGRHKGVGVHSIRQPGRSAHHDVIFGAPGQTLTLSHDTLSRDCYMPGVLHALRQVVNIKGLVLGLDKILGV